MKMTRNKRKRLQRKFHPTDKTFNWRARVGPRLDMYADSYLLLNSDAPWLDFTSYVTKCLRITTNRPTWYANEAAARICMRGIRSINKEPWVLVDLFTHYIGALFIHKHYRVDAVTAHTRCANCGLAYMTHTEDGKCLYDPTTWAPHSAAPEACRWALNLDTEQMEKLF